MKCAILKLEIKYLILSPPPPNQFQLSLTTSLRTTLVCDSHTVLFYLLSYENLLSVSRCALFYIPLFKVFPRNVLTVIFYFLFILNICY